MTYISEYYITCHQPKMSIIPDKLNNNEKGLSHYESVPFLWSIGDTKIL